MRLTGLSVTDFRNIPALRFEPAERFNLLYGENGQGKTNILEAVHLLGNPRSFRICKVNDLISSGMETAAVRGNIVSEKSSHTIHTVLEKDGRRVLLDGKGVSKASELHGKLTTVVYSPDDTAMAKNSPDLRRRFLDRAVYSSSALYLSCWHDYRKIIKHRNQLLKQRRRSELAVWDEKLAETGGLIMHYRYAYISELKPLLHRYYSILSGNGDYADIDYSLSFSSLVEPCANPEELKNSLLDIFAANIDKDEATGSTGAGPHRDDLMLSINGRGLKSHASQGEIKSYILALKMAEIEHLSDIFGEPPVLLLDDISSELDEGRKRNLVDFVTEQDIQVFITTTDKRSFYRKFSKSALCRIESGRLILEEKRE